MSTIKITEQLGTVKKLEGLSERVMKGYLYKDYNKSIWGYDDYLIQAHKLYLLRDCIRAYEEMVKHSEEPIFFDSYTMRRCELEEESREESEAVTFKKTMYHSYLHYYGKLLLNLIIFKNLNGITDSLESSETMEIEFPDIDRWRDPEFDFNGDPDSEPNTNDFLQLAQKLSLLTEDGNKELLHSQLTECMNMLLKMGETFDADPYGLANLVLTFIENKWSL